MACTASDSIREEGGKRLYVSFGLAALGTVYRLKPLPTLDVVRRCLTVCI
jgi:hypothetical protein